PVLANHNGIDYQRALDGTTRNRFNDGRRSQRSRLGCLGRKIFEDGVDLSSDQRGFEHLNARHAGGVLDSDESDRGGAIDVQLMERLQVGLNTRSAAGV